MVSIPSKLNSSVIQPLSQTLKTVASKTQVDSRVALVAITLLAIVAAVIFLVRRRRQEQYQSQPGNNTHTFATYNCGQLGDAESVLDLKKRLNGGYQLPSGESTKKDQNDFRSIKPDFISNSELKEIRTAGLKATIQKVVNQGSQILCLQEIIRSDVQNDRLNFLPAGFNSVRLIPEDDLIGWAVAWDTSRYENVHQYLEPFDVESSSAGRRYAVIVELKDKQNGKVLRVASAQLHGYNIQGGEWLNGSNEENKAEVLEREKNKLEEAAEMFNGLLGRIKTVKDSEYSQWAFSQWLIGYRAPPGAVIIGMDSNATPASSPSHFQHMETHGFQREKGKEIGTNYNYDVLRAVQLDYVGVCPLQGTTATLGEMCTIKDDQGRELQVFEGENPSDHLPLIQTVTIR